jgi:uncharacterized protein (DUF362 family)
MINDPITRRTAIKRIVSICGSISLPFIAPMEGMGSSSQIKSFAIVGEGKTQEFNPGRLIKKVFHTAGGIGRFISRGDVVAIKPNISWARQPEYGATTNPQVLEEVVKLCFEAGAKKVLIADNTIHSPSRCFAITGAGMVAKNTGAQLILPRSYFIKDMNIRGRRLDIWPVFIPFVEADKVINIPIAKHHQLSGLTLGMKNWIGAVGGRRNALHQDIHQSIVDLARFFSPHLTIIDAIRIMVRNGPSGGSLEDVKVKNIVILSNDPVLADALGAKIFGIRPGDIGYIRLAKKQGLGQIEAESSIKRVIL